MGRFVSALCAVALSISGLLALASVAAVAGEPGPLGPLVGVSWAYFQEERWKTDQAALESELARHGARVASSDAQGSSERQLADVETLIARGIDVLVLVAHDADAIGPAVALARAEGIPVIAYDRLIEAPGVFYLSFDNREVGRLEARAILAARPRGDYVFVKGAPTDPNAHLVHAGQLDVLGPVISSGGIRIVGDQFVDGWLPELAQRIMEQILTANGNRVDAVVVSNDGMAGGVVAALAAQGLVGIPVSGQDGDRAALARVARGAQTVSVWKDARRLGSEAARVAIALAAGTPPDAVEGAVRFRRGPAGVEVPAILLEPVAITRENLGLVVDAGWIARDELCRGAGSDPPPACR